MLSSDKRWVEDTIRRMLGQAKMFTRRVQTGLSSAILAQERPNILPLVPVIFIDPEIADIFTAANDDYTVYYDDPGDGDSITYGADGFTITAKASGEGEFPEYDCYSRTAGMVPLTDITVTKVAVTNNFFTTERDYAVVGVRWDSTAHTGENYFDCRPGAAWVEGRVDAHGHWSLKPVTAIMGEEEFDGQDAAVEAFDGQDAAVDTGISIDAALDFHFEYKDGTFTMSYRQNIGGAWAALYTSTSYEPVDGYLFMAAGKPNFGCPDETLTVHSILVKDIDRTGTADAFILTESWRSFLKDWVYIKLPSGGIMAIKPIDKMVVRCVTDDLLYEWNGTAWAVYTHVLATDTALGGMHTISGGAAGYVFRCDDATHGKLAQLQHTDLGGVTSDQHHPQLHAASHSNGGGDEVTVENLGTGAANGKLLQSANNGGLAMVNPSTLPHYKSPEMLLALMLSEV